MIALCQLMLSMFSCLPDVWLTRYILITQYKIADMGCGFLCLWSVH